MPGLLRQDWEDSAGGSLPLRRDWRPSVRAATLPATRTCCCAGWSTCISASGAPANCVGGTEPDIVSETDQAMYVARQWLVNAMEGISVSIYYDNCMFLTSRPLQTLTHQLGLRSVLYVHFHHLSRPWSNRRQQW